MLDSDEELRYVYESWQAIPLFARINTSVCVACQLEINFINFDPGPILPNTKVFKGKAIVMDLPSADHSCPRVNWKEEQ